MKKVKTLCCILILTFLCTGCGTTYKEATQQTQKPTSDNDYGNGYFTVITKWDGDNAIYKIVYANDTKVKYLIISGGSRLAITPLYNTDGTLQTYTENNTD